MSWSDIRPTAQALALLAVVLLAGCGFRPLYGGDGGREVARELALVEIAPIDHDLGVEFRERLRDEIAARKSDPPPAYDLAVELSTDNVPQVTERDALIRRFRLVLTAVYRLTAKSDGALLDQGTVRASASYNIIRAADFPSLVAEQDAGRQAARIASREIVNRLSLVFDRARSAAR